ncbi:MAG TPA: 1-deoxy-D-xylulose-5-phosphate reductoisomerase [Gammaproteobacteria bacterium]|nr:1-deoxy-D-xylulose-5-phosphate reductoisomerase [Gammaproteobacteria bacterium]
MPESSAAKAKKVTVLGSTGTIGVNTLNVIRRHPARYKVAALTAHQDVTRLYQQCLEFKPPYAVMGDQDKARELDRELRQAGLRIEVLAGAAGLEQIAALTDADCVMAAIVGAAGLLPTLAAARAGKRVLLANKEALVMAGELFMREVCGGCAELLPIDSEHNAVFQCMPQGLLPPSGGNTGLERAGAERILLTASGGPFRDLPLSALGDVTPAQACAHPNWVMGRKISVDSATMMNKGLEVIEACWLFGCRPDQIEVVLHPQSVVHSLVAFADGSMLAQLGNPDMRTPIAHALAWPERITSGVRRLNLIEVARLEFRELDPARFPCLPFAFDALRAGGTSTAILNAANEVAVQSFLNQQISFTAIPRVIEHALERVDSVEANSLDVILAADHAARAAADDYIASKLTSV